jgi:hypothetical protein
LLLLSNAHTGRDMKYWGLSFRDPTKPIAAWPQRKLD